MNIELSQLHSLVMNFLEVSVLLFIFCLGLAFLVILYLYLSDSLQTSQSVRRNFPVIGRFRSLFETLGEFFRQYFFAMDREELPFNRAQREWIYKASDNKDTTSAFGSTLPLLQPGTFIFLNSPYPVMEQNATSVSFISFGEGFAKFPYKTNSLFNISGMSFGALSAPAVQSLAKGAASAGCWINTGEGGISSHHLQDNPDIVFQIGTARYGVRDSAGNLDVEKLKEVAQLESVRMFELKLSQGAKPGKGGILPGAKVTEEIARVRNIPPFNDSISPNAQPGITCNHELLDFIHHIRSVTGKPTGFKAVIGQLRWIDSLCQTINQMGLEYAPDFITIDSADGGTGAAPATLMDHMGLPVIISLPHLITRLNQYGLRDRIKVICSGKMVNPAQVAGALCVGADAVVSARGFMFSLGCIQALKCNKNTCPTGISTHNPDLQRGLVVSDKAIKVNNYVQNIIKELETIAHACGVSEPRLLRSEHALIVNERGIPVAINEYLRSDDQAEIRGQT